MNKRLSKERLDEIREHIHDPTYTDYGSEISMPEEDLHDLLSEINALRDEIKGRKLPHNLIPRCGEHFDIFPTQFPSYSLLDSSKCYECAVEKRDNLTMENGTLASLLERAVIAGEKISDDRKELQAELDDSRSTRLAIKLERARAAIEKLDDKNMMLANTIAKDGEEIGALRGELTTALNAHTNAVQYSKYLQEENTKLREEHCKLVMHFEDIDKLRSEYEEYQVRMCKENQELSKERNAAQRSLEETSQETEQLKRNLGATQELTKGSLLIKDFEILEFRKQVVELRKRITTIQNSNSCLALENEELSEHRDAYNMNRKQLNAAVERLSNEKLTYLARIRNLRETLHWYGNAHQNQLKALEAISEDDRAMSESIV